LSSGTTDQSWVRRSAPKKAVAEEAGVDQMERLFRIPQADDNMAPLRTFRVQFLGSPATRTENVVEERIIRAEDLQEAARQVGEFPWPGWARSYRIIDVDGQELAHIFKLDH
jgi:hypothetical protein